MDFRLVEMASKQTDVLFNLFSLRMKYLVRNQTCECCKQSVQEWIYIRICHNTLCEKCFEHVKYKKTSICPVCNLTFDPNQDTISSINMKKSFNQLEEFIFSLLSLEKETSDLLYNKDESNARQKIRTDEPYCLNFNQNSTPENKNLKVIEYEQYLETSVLNELQFNNAACSDTIVDNSIKYNICDKQQSTCKNSSALNLENSVAKKTASSILQVEKNLEVIENMNDEQLSSDNDISDSDSDENMVYGTPPNNRSLVVSDHKNLFDRKDICITYSNFNPNDLIIIKHFYEMFKVRINVEWNDEVTHLIIKRNVDGTYARTRKCINAILSHCYIVTDEWVLNSIKEKSILSEQEYMPLDECGEASALRSWRIGRGIINSSMIWAERCILHFHSSVVTHDYFTAFKGWALKVGFTVIELMEEFNSVESDLRIILTDFRNPEKEINAAVNLELINWLKTFKAITVHLDWFLDVLCRYRRVLIEPHYQVLKLNFSMIEFAGINENLVSTE